MRCLYDEKITSDEAMEIMIIRHRLGYSYFYLNNTTDFNDDIVRIVLLITKTTLGYEREYNSGN